MDCLNSFFEIGGHILDGSASLQSSLPTTSIPGVLTRSAGLQASAMGGNEIPDRRLNFTAVNSKDTLFEHWVRTSLHPIREFGELTRREQIAFVKRPYLLGLYGIGKHLEVIEMHREYVFD